MKGSIDGPISDRLLTVDRAAEMMSLHPQTLRKYARCGAIASYRLGRRSIRFRASDITAFIEKHLCPAKDQNIRSSNFIAASGVSSGTKANSAREALRDIRMKNALAGI
ncbi:helix-turn-helix domain-containing protein [Acetobacter estunensis]|nr:helix-turn-helix domain-containing protein [Acetobacter estunensis]MBV1836124.1 helix-turn-helix domain-containing protein [Acetobacter estunensis]